jgi:hypothetical protein
MAQEQSLRDGRYVVRAVLGEGAQGITYEATDEQTGASVAVKRFNVGSARSWKEVELAERETRVLATLDHPLVPRYIEHFEEDGGLFLVMQKVEGETLDAIRRREGPMSETEVRRFLACADRALTYLHGRASPVVHRDVKPRNVVRRPDGSYVLVDFGAVRELLVRGGASTVVGTIGYMAPEQLQGRALPATDVYAVGATALAALTGVEPETLPHKGLRVDVRAALEGRTSPELVAALERMLEPDPDVRPRSLAAALDGINTSLPPPPPHRGEPLAVARSGVALRERAPAYPADAVESAKEDAMVKSARSLLWMLWGLGWILVPVVLAEIHAARAIPIVMFGSMAMLLVLTWHKGALLRPLFRKLGLTTDTRRLEAADPSLRLPSAPPVFDNRVRVAEDNAHIRVRGSELPAEDAFTATDVSSTTPESEARRRR